jgi:hypothetical protein
MSQTKKIIDGLSDLDLYLFNGGSHYRLYVDKSLNSNSSDKLFKGSNKNSVRFKYESILFKF